MMKYTVLLGLLVTVGCSGGPNDPQTGTEQQEAKKCVETQLCVIGYVWSQKACACIPDKKPDHVTCGTKTCGAGEYCCNASCGICAPEGYACIQIACGQ